MRNGTRALLLLVVLGAAVACGSGTALDTPQREGEVVNGTTGLKVTATIAAASLGDASSNVQIAFVATAGAAPAAVEITSVALVDNESFATVETLKASAPSVWNGRSYETWNERVTPGGDLQASYQISSPDWSKIDSNGGSSRRSSTSYSTPYRLRLTLRIDGSEIVLDSGTLQRESFAMT